MPTARAALLLALAGSCVRGGPASEVVDATTPTPEVYPEGPSDFTGEWVGESAGVFGTLMVKRLAADRYYARFQSEDGLVRYVCNVRQVQATPPAGGAVTPANLAVFSWQDGRGGRGEGWVLINREGSALTGEIRIGASAAWDFVRVDAPDVEVGPPEQEPPAAAAAE